MKSGESDDSELMRAVSAGSVDAFERLYDRFWQRAYRVAYAVCADEGCAQDAVQDAFWTLWKSRTTYIPERGTVSSWLLTLVRYRAIDLARQNGPHRANCASDDRLDECAAPDDVNATILQRDAANHLRVSLSLLPEAQQEVIVLAYYGQLSHTEIATRLHLPPGTVKGRMRLGLQKLRTSLDQATLDG